MNAAGRNGGNASARAIAVSDHADAENAGTEDHSQHVRRLDVIGGVAHVVQRQYANASNDNGREHDFQDGEVL